MAISTQLVSGLSSGFDWRSMIDQLMAVEHRSVDLVENQKTDYESKLEIFQSINTKLLSFRTQAGILADSDAFNVFTSSLSTNSSNYSASSFFSVSTSTSATPGNHTITMNASSKVAKARHISSKSFASYNTALGLEGEFIINGRAVKVETSHDLADIRDKINNMNSGANATGITASILTVSASNYRLVLTSDETGEDAFTIFDASSGAQNVLSAGLGFTDTAADATSVKNLISNGVQSEAFSSSSQAVGSMLGLSTSQSGTVTIGHASDPDQFTVSIDISDSLTEIAAAINNAAGDSDVTASVVSTTTDNVTTYRLKIANTTSFVDDNHVLETLGILEGDQTNVAEEHLSDTALSEIGGGSITADDTYWTEIDTGGGSCNSVTGDTITFTGVNHVGAAVSGSYTVDLTTNGGLGDLVQVFLTAIEDAFTTEDPDYQVTASIEDGKIKITDNVAGDSQLSLTVTCNNEHGGTLDFGTIAASTEGYKKQVQAGQDANIIIDGTAVTSSSNVIDGVIAGVKLNLLAVENGSTVDLTISRDHNTIKSSVQTLLDAYNGIMADINEQFAYDEETETGGLLQGDSTLFSIKSNLVDIVTSAITGLPTTLNALSLIGITTDNDGNLTIDSDDFADAMTDDFNGLRRIFIAEGSTTDGDVEYLSHTNDTVAGEFDVVITTAATQATVTGSVDLSGGIASDMSTITITQGSRVGVINLLGASGENGSSVDNIVNAINSELDAAYAQTLMGSVKMTTDAAKETAITSSTTWNNVRSNGVANTLANNDVIEFSGTTSNGATVSGTYTISNVATDTVQGLLSAIEAEFGYEVSAAINSYGYLTATDNTNRDSSLAITITEPSTKGLDFGAVTTSNLVGSGRLTTDGSTAIAATDTWDDINGETLVGTETIYFSGYTASGEAVEGSYAVNKAEALSVFLGVIETAYGGGVDADIIDGRIVLTDGISNSTLGIEILEPSGTGVDFGTVSGGVTGRYSMDVTASKDGSNQLVLTHDEYGSSQSFAIQVSDADLGLTDNQTYSGVDVAGTINSEAATGSGQILTGSAPGSGETTSVQGLSIKYTGTASGDQGAVKITMGVAELFDRVLFDITNITNGYLDYRIESMGDRISDLEDDIKRMEARLDLKMERMINRFVAMETALAAMQSQSQWLTGQVNASYSGWG